MNVCRAWHWHVSKQQERAMREMRRGGGGDERGGNAPPMQPPPAPPAGLGIEQERRGGRGGSGGSGGGGGNQGVSTPSPTTISLAGSLTAHTPTSPLPT